MHPFVLRVSLDLARSSTAEGGSFFFLRCLLFLQGLLRSRADELEQKQSTMDAMDGWVEVEVQVRCGKWQLAHGSNAQTALCDRRTCLMKSNQPRLCD